MSGAPPGGWSTSEIDVDADYREWRRSLEAARNAVARVYGGSIAAARKVIPMPRPGKRHHRPWAAVASIVVVLGAGAWIWDLQKESDRLARELEIERQPESTIPSLLAPLGTRRGSTEELVVPPGARSIALLIDAANSDRLEIRDAAGDEVCSPVRQQRPGSTSTPWAWCSTSYWPARALSAAKIR